MEEYHLVKVSDHLNSSENFLVRYIHGKSCKIYSNLMLSSIETINVYYFFLFYRYNCSYFGNGVSRNFKDYNCSQIWTAFIVPFRKREQHLQAYLNAIKEHQINNSQENNYEILIIEQEDSAKFNRAKLMNVGAKFASLHLQEKCNIQKQIDKNLCLILHDIDMLPLNSNLQYNCEKR